MSSDWLSAFAPASAANFGSGFDAFAAALASVERTKGSERTVPLGDVVRVRRAKRRGVRVVAVSGDGGKLPRAATRNTAAVAAAALLRECGAPFGLDLELVKGLPLSSGLGSSAASAAAGAFAAALACGIAADKVPLVGPALAGEHVADGSWHGDNVWASLLGGGVVVISTRPAEILPLPAPRGLRLLVVHPAFELSTRRARAVLRPLVPLGDAAAQAGRFGSLVAAWISGDRELLGAALEDRLAEPFRAPLVPGYVAARRAALAAGAFGVTFSGAGPSLLAVTPDGDEEKVGRAITAAFARGGLAATTLVAAVDRAGARAASAAEARRVAAAAASRHP